MLKRKFFYWLTISNFLYIIVLLILAGITISSLSGENGILTRAEEARDKTEIATIEEQIELAKMSSLDDNGEIIKQTLKSELEKIEGIDNIIDKVNGVQVEYKGKSQFIPTGNGKIELGEDELEDIADDIIEGQEEQDYVIGIDVYGNQVDLANWDYGFYNADLLLMYTGKIENGTIIGEIPAYIIKSESGIVTKGAVTVLEGTFMDKTDLKTINVAFPKTITYYSGIFANSGITSIPPKINMDKAQSTYGMFQNCTGLTEIPQSFNLANASNLQFCGNMFEGCTNLTTIPEGFALPSSVTITEKMFFNTKITEIPQSFNLVNASNLQICAKMFEGCTNLATIPEGFALPSSVTTTEKMFFNTKITEIPQSFNLANLSNLTSCARMFENCTELITIPEGFDLPPSITNINHMFTRTAITEIPDSFNFKDLPNLYNCGYVFERTNLTSLPEDFALPNSIKVCSGMFSNTELTSLPEEFNLVNLTKLEECSWMFQSVPLTTLPEDFALPSSLKDCSGMFHLCSKLKTIPDTFILGENVEQCRNMFESAIELEHIPNNFIIPSKVTNMSGIFDNCVKLTGSVTIEGNPTEYEAAFKGTASNAGQAFVVNYTSKCTNIEGIKATVENGNVQFNQI